jgi:hypothetical protein
MTPRALLATSSIAIALLVTGCMTDAMSASPTAMVTVVKVDVDTATDLKQKYGVMVSDTFVKVDSTGAKAMTWSRQPVSDVLAALKG